MTGHISYNIPLCMPFFSAPGRPPENVFATNKTTPTMIPVSWEPIRDPYYVHGILLGYTVSYRAIRNPNKELEEEEKNVTVGPKTTYVELQDLSSFTVYSIKVRAFTRRGNGTPSAVIFAGKLIFLYSNCIIGHLLCSPTSFPGSFPSQGKALETRLHVHYNSDIRNQNLKSQPRSHIFG